MEICSHAVLNEIYRTCIAYTESEMSNIMCKGVYFDPHMILSCVLTLCPENGCFVFFVPNYKMKPVLYYVL